MKAKLISLQGTIEAEGSPEELAKFFREYNGWTLVGSVSSSGTLPGPLAPLPFSPGLNVPPMWTDPVAPLIWPPGTTVQPIVVHQMNTTTSGVGSA